MINARFFFNPVEAGTKEHWVCSASCVALNVDNLCCVLIKPQTRMYVDVVLK